MRTRNPRKSGFTLLELVVVLAILAIVTTLAMRSLDHVDDQQRAEANRRGFEALRDAVLGFPEERHADGSRSISGFVADMGRLPRALEIQGNLTLAELWMRAGASYDVRPATLDHGVPAAFVDAQVLVPGGWRGPYLHLPMATEHWRDGWGNPMITRLAAGSVNPDAEGYGRLRDLSDRALSSAGEEIRIIRHLGANGTLGPADSGNDQDGSLVFDNASYQASITAQIEVMDGDEPETVDPTHQVTLCAFSPDPDDPAKIRVLSQSQPFGANPMVMPAVVGLTQGPRVVRAYYHPAGDPPNSFRKSTVKHAVLRPGVNFLELSIDR